MPRQSTIRRLPPEIRELIGQLLDQGRTLDEVLAKLHELGQEVSRSALGRYSKSLDQVGETLRRSRAVAEALVSKLGQGPESKITRLNVELMHNVIMDLLIKTAEAQDAEPEEGEDHPPVALDPMGAMLLGKALDHLARASKADAELIGKIKEQAKREAEAKLEQSVSKAGEAVKGKNLSPRDVLELLKKIYRGEA